MFDEALVAFATVLGSAEVYPLEDYDTRENYGRHAIWLRDPTDPRRGEIELEQQDWPAKFAGVTVTANNLHDSHNVDIAAWTLDPMGREPDDDAPLTDIATCVAEAVAWMDAHGGPMPRAVAV